MNKKIALFFVSILISYAAISQSCPTCVGRLEQNSPTFFSEEFYQQSENENSYEEADFKPCSNCKEESYDCKACGCDEKEESEEKS